MHHPRHCTYVLTDQSVDFQTGSQSTLSPFCSSKSTTQTTLLSMSAMLLHNLAADVSSNYLQSPYFFMCCSLLPADERSNEQIPPETLTGATVSSLHRLKDIDNTGIAPMKVSLDRARLTLTRRWLLRLWRFASNEARPLSDAFQSF